MCHRWTSSWQEFDHLTLCLHLIWDVCSLSSGSTPAWCPWGQSSERRWGLCGQIWEAWEGSCREARTCLMFGKGWVHNESQWISRGKDKDGCRFFSIALQCFVKLVFRLCSPSFLYPAYRILEGFYMFPSAKQTNQLWSQLQFCLVAPSRPTSSLISRGMVSRSSEVYWLTTVSPPQSAPLLLSQGCSASHLCLQRPLSKEVSQTTSWTPHSSRRSLEEWSWGEPITLQDHFATVYLWAKVSWHCHRSSPEQQKTLTLSSSFDGPRQQWCTATRFCWG